MAHAALTNESPEEVAQKLAATHDRAWIRSVVQHLDQQLQKEPLDRLITLWALSGAEAAQMFQVSRQAFAKWLQSGPPPDRAPAIAMLADATDLLERHLKRERIPVVVRRRSELTGNSTLIELARQGMYDEVLATVNTMFDLRRVQP